MEWSLFPTVFWRNAIQKPGMIGVVFLLENAPEPGSRPLRRSPNKGVPWPPLLNRERSTSSRQSLDIVNGLLRLGAALGTGSTSAARTIPPRSTTKHPGMGKVQLALPFRTRESLPKLRQTACKSSGNVNLRPSFAA
jgi:hypothetical protein